MKTKLPRIMSICKYYSEDKGDMSYMLYLTDYVRGYNTGRYRFEKKYFTSSTENTSTWYSSNVIFSHGQCKRGFSQTTIEKLFKNIKHFLSEEVRYSV